jgi:hypothetical protein
MADMARIKIQTHGPEFWQITVTDADTGKLIPVFWDEHHGIELRVRDGGIFARVDLMVTEIDAECAAGMMEQIRYLCEHGEVVRIVGEVAAQPTETADEFAERTVAMVTRGGD